MGAAGADAANGPAARDRCGRRVPGVRARLLHHRRDPGSGWRMGEEFAVIDALFLVAEGVRSSTVRESRVTVAALPDGRASDQWCIRRYTASKWRGAGRANQLKIKSARLKLSGRSVLLTSFPLPNANKTNASNRSCFHAPSSSAG